MNDNNPKNKMPGGLDNTDSYGELMQLSTTTTH